MAEKLDLTVEPGSPLIVMSRVFDAPRDLVFQAYTDPAHIPQWWGPSYLTTTVDRMEPRAGGSWRIVQRDGDGGEFAFRGVYHAVDAPERIVYTFEFEGMPGHVLMETIVFDDIDGKTRLTDISSFQSVEDRDGMVASGMEEGARETMDRFAELLRRIKAGVHA